MEYIVNNINFFNPDLSFWTYRRRIIDFRNIGLWLVLIYDLEIIKVLISDIDNKPSVQSLKLFAKAAKILMNCFCFTFSIGYFEQEIEADLNEPAVVQVFSLKFNFLFSYNLLYLVPRKMVYYTK
jgi:hypothetical protein